MKKEALENEASYLSHGLREAAFLFDELHESEKKAGSKGGKSGSRYARGACPAIVGSTPAVRDALAPMPQQVGCSPN